MKCIVLNSAKLFTWHSTKLNELITTNETQLLCQILNEETYKAQKSIKYNKYEYFRL